MSDGGGNAGSAADRSFRPFQLLIRLHYLRSQTCSWVRGPSSDLTGKDTEEILWTLRGLAVTARTTGVDAYAAICLHLAELIEPLIRMGGMPGAIRRVLTRWADHSDRYLRHPGDPVHAVRLIEHLNQPEWGSPFSRDEQGVLIRALREPFARLESKAVKFAPSLTDGHDARYRRDLCIGAFGQSPRIVRAQ